MTTHYYPKIFDVENEQRARELILTNEGENGDTNLRWDRETPYFFHLIHEAVGLRPDMVVLDYGCGIGRMAKALIDGTGCRVIGVDISSSMRRLAIDYVKSDKFMVVSPDELDILTSAGFRVHAAIAIWVLQHCLSPKQDIMRIRNTLNDKGSFFVVNMPKRAIPVIQESGGMPGQFAWASDKINVADLLRSRFHVVDEEVANDPSLPQMAEVGAFWMNLIC